MLLLFNIVLEVLALAIKEEKGINVIQVGKKEAKLSVFPDNMIPCIENLKDSIRKLELIHESAKVIRYKINTEKLLVFLYANNKRSETRKLTI